MTNNNIISILCKENLNITKTQKHNCHNHTIITFIQWNLFPNRALAKDRIHHSMPYDLPSQHMQDTISIWKWTNLVVMTYVWYVVLHQFQNYKEVRTLHWVAVAVLYLLCNIIIFDMKLLMSLCCTYTRASVYAS